MAAFAPENKQFHNSETAKRFVLKHAPQDRRLNTDGLIGNLN